jgi:hypothetical protein
MSFSVITYSSSRRSKARIQETRITSRLMDMRSAGTHELHGHHGARILTEIAELWNAVNYSPGGTVTRCAGDMLSQSARRKFFTGGNAR